MIAAAISIPTGVLVYFLMNSSSDYYWEEYHKEEREAGKRVGPSVENHAIPNELFCPEVDSLWIPLPHIEKHLVFVDYNDRPDSEERSLILLGLRGATSEKVIKEGEKVYFSCIDQDRIAFSENPTPFYAVVNLSDKEGLEVDLRAEFLDETRSQLFENNAHFTISERQPVRLADDSLKELISSFALAKCYAPDQLIAVYGGVHYEDIRGMHRLSVPFSSGVDHFYVKKGDLLVREDDRWVLTRDNTRGKPLAMIKSIQGGHCELVLWSEEGIFSTTLSLSVISGKSLSSSVNEIFTKIHKRSASSVICEVGKKSMILRKGDWLLNQNGKWKSVRGASDLKEFLGYALKGELFIFDGIENRGGSSFFTGHYFNEDRTQVLKVEIKLNEKAKRPKALSKKPRSLSKLSLTEPEGREVSE